MIHMVLVVWVWQVGLGVGQGQALTFPMTSEKPEKPAKIKPRDSRHLLVSLGLSIYNYGNSLQKLGYC